MSAFYAILDTAYVERGRWVETCRALLEGGAGVVQVRAKRETSPEREALLTEVLPLFGTTAAPLVVNDDLELARRHPGVGLHIGQDDTPPGEARRVLGPGRLIGLSTHSATQAAAAIELARDGVIDYFAVGPVFATRTKPDYEPVGLGLVRQVAGQLARVPGRRPPFYCIGGINRQNLPSVRAAGAEGVVAVSDVLTDADVASAVAEYCR